MRPPLPEALLPKIYTGSQVLCKPLCASRGPISQGGDGPEEGREDNQASEFAEASQGTERGEVEEEMKRE